jgi:hypothetical protein
LVVWVVCCCNEEDEQSCNEPPHQSGVMEHGEERRAAKRVWGLCCVSRWGELDCAKVGGGASTERASLGLVVTVPERTRLCRLGKDEGRRSKGGGGWGGRDRRSGCEVEGRSRRGVRRGRGARVVVNAKLESRWGDQAGAGGRGVGAEGGGTVVREQRASKGASRRDFCGRVGWGGAWVSRRSWGRGRDE